jgi:isopentenyl diphosphate isomerase/L-lactate dehydrogenase-like FMN-dependent dehydrogenase
VLHGWSALDRRRLARCYNIADLREAGRRRLPKGIFEYVDRGTEDEVALANNRAAFERVKLRNRVLVDVSKVELGTSVFGKPAALPLAIAPTGIAGLCWYEGELELAKAAAAAGVPFTLATGSNTAMEKVAREAGGRLWFQLYLWDKRELSFELVARARDAGFEALILTVDTALGANREHNQRNGFSVPFRPSAQNLADLMLHPAWLQRVLLRYLATSGMPRHENYPKEYQERITGAAGTKRDLRAHSMAWEDVEKLRGVWPRTLILKGILHPDDAREAVSRGVDGIVVSNHGGRNMDSACAPLDVLPQIVDAVGGRTTVLLDSGVRRGSDIVKALALGAAGVLVGRATLYGVMVGGQAGAERAIAILENEFRRTLAYVGCRSPAEVTSAVLVRQAAAPGPLGFETRTF